MMNFEISIPNFKKVTGDNDKPYTVFCIAVTVSGRQHIVEKRYREFETLHKKIKKCVEHIPFPPKTVLKWNPKVLESRRQSLQHYLQMLLRGDVLPKSLLTFLQIPTLLPSESMESLDSSDLSLSHQPLLVFADETYLHEPPRGPLPDIVVAGVIQGFYDSQDDIS